MAQWEVVEPAESAVTENFHQMDRGPQEVSTDCKAQAAVGVGTPAERR